MKDYYCLLASYRSAWFSGSLYIYEQGFLFVHPRAGAIVLPTSKLSKVQFYDKVITHLILRGIYFRLFLQILYNYFNISAVKNRFPCQGYYYFIVSLVQDSSSAVLILTCYPSIKDNLPYYLTVKQSHVVLALTPRSRIYRQFYSNVIHLWKENQLPGFAQFETVDGTMQRFLFQAR